MSNPHAKPGDIVSRALASALFALASAWPTFAIATSTPEEGYRAYYQALRGAQKYTDLASYIPERMPRMRAESIDRFAKEKSLSKAERDTIDQNSLALQRNTALKNDIVAVKVERTIPAAGQRPEMALLEVQLRNAANGATRTIYPVMENEKGTWKFAGERFPAQAASKATPAPTGKPAPAAAKLRPIPKEP